MKKANILLHILPLCLLVSAYSVTAQAKTGQKAEKYNGEDTVANGFALRTDIHTLFDTGHLRISVEGVIDLSTRARMDYGAAIPPRIVIPDFINREFLKWRWDNYNGL